MAVSLKHTFTSAKADGPDTTLVQPSNWNAEHQLTLATNSLLGRSTAGTGAAEEIAVGSGLTLAAGTLSAASAGAMIFIDLDGGAAATTIFDLVVDFGDATYA